MLDFVAWLLGHRAPPDKIDIAVIRAKIEAENAEEDRLIDEYLALPDRPRPMQVTYQITGCLTPTLSEGVDLVHWGEWSKARRNELHCP